MDFPTTFSALAVALVVFALANYMSRKPVEVGKVRYVPWIGIQFLAVLSIVILLAHMVSLWTGTPLKSRFYS